MLHLAQVQKNLISGEIQLCLLAYQKPDKLWKTVDFKKFINLPENSQFHERVLVLIDLDENQEITEIKEATEWVIELVEKYLASMILTPEFMKEEAARIEEWRQDIALKNQELTQTKLEIETRREQLQELEENLKKQQEKLDLKKKEDEDN